MLRDSLVTDLRVWPPSSAPVVTALALAIALAGPPCLVIAMRLVLGQQPSLAGQVAGQVALCAMAALVAGPVVRRERLPLASLGLRRPDAWTAVTALGAGCGAYYVLPFATVLLTRVVGSEGLDDGLAAIASQPIWWRVCVALTSGPVEEILYRGYAVERLGTLVQHLATGGALAAVAFAVAHIPFWGVGPALALNLPFGLLMVAAYLWRRDVIAVTLAHTGLLLVSLLSV